MIGTKYKQTEVGIIPADWDVTSIENTCNCYAGATPSTSNPNYWAGGNIPWMSSGEVNYRRIYATECHITKLGFDNSSTKWVPKHSVVMALAGQGKTRGMVAINEIELCTNQSLCAIVPQSHLNYLYLYYNLYSRYNELREISGDARSGLNLFLIKNIHIPLPSSEEQKCIAQSLSDMDALLVSLDKLISKKKAIKHGAMQQMLTGQKRLCGFNEPWETYRLNELCELFGRIGFRGYTKNDLVRKGEGAITFSPSDIIDSKIHYDSCTYISLFKYEESPEIKVFNGDIIFCKTASIGKCALIENLHELGTINPQFVVLKNFKCDNVLLYYKLISNDFQEQVKSISGGSTISTLSQEKFKQLTLVLPTSIAEQRAIASILSDMDAEITELESKKAKYTAIKQGMMQQLLTGKIRLINE